MPDTHEPSDVAEPTIFPTVDPADVAGAAPVDDQPAPRRGRGRPRKDGKAPGSVPPAPKGTAPKGPGRPSTRAQRATRVADLYGQLGGMLQFAGIASTRALVVGSAMTANAGALGEAWATWAETNPRVAKLIDGMSFGGGAVAVLLAHLPIVLALIGPEPGDPLGDALGGGGAGLTDLLGAVFGSPAAPA